LLGIALLFDLSARGSEGMFNLHDLGAKGDSLFGPSKRVKNTIA
jgi:hypothetical protein